MKKFTYNFLILVLLFLVSSCNMDNFDFNKLSDDVNVSPEFVVPLAKANVSVWDLIESVNDDEDSLVTVGDDGVVNIVYTEEGIYNYQVKDLLDLPTSQSFSTEETIGNIKLGDITGERAVTISQLQEQLSGDIDYLEDGNQTLPSITYSDISSVFEVDPVDGFKSVTIASGKLSITLSNMGLQTSTISVGGEIYDKNYPYTKIASFLIENVMNGDPVTETVDLSNLSISNKFNFKLTKFEIIPSGFPESISLSSNLFQLSLGFSDLEISSGKVKVEEQTLEGFSGSFNFSFDDDIKVYEAEMNYGNLSVEVNNNSEITGTLSLSFPGITGESLNDITFETLGSGSMSLANSTINLGSDDTTPYNTVPYEYSLTINGSGDKYIDFNSSQSLSLTVDLQNIEFKSITGDFGERSITIDPGSFDLDTEFLDKIEGNFKLSNPTLDLILNNSIGIPAVVDASFTAQSKTGETATIDTTGLVIEPRSSISSPVVKQTVTFDNSNSNIVDFMALPPSGDINYSGNILFNADGAVSQSNPNFFNLDDSLRIDLGVDLPLELQVENLSFLDTASINGDDLDMIGSAELIINAVNEIPLDIDVQLFFIDTISGQQYGSAIESSLLSSGTIDSPTTTTNTITLDEDDIDNLQKANGIVFKGIISSPKNEENETQTAVLYSESMLNISVVIKSEIDL